MTSDIVDGFYVIHVPTGEVGEVTGTMATDMGVLPLRKTGEGTLRAGDALASYTGDIHIDGGVYQLTSIGGVGTSAGATYVTQGATLTVDVRITGATSDWSQDSSGYETYHLSGTGFGGMGALNVPDNGRFDFKNITLDDHALLRTGNNAEIQVGPYGRINLDGKTLSVNMGDGSYWIYFQYCHFLNPGSIVIEKGQLRLGVTKTVEGDYNNLFRVRDGGKLAVQTESIRWPWAIVFEDGAALWSGQVGTAVGADFHTRQVWDGPVQVGGITAFSTYDDTCAFTFAGIVSGNGGFSSSKGTLRFANKSNSFRGAISAAGNRSADGTCKGGVDLLGVGTFGNSTGLSLTNANVRLLDDTVCSFASPSIGDFLPAGTTIPEYNLRDFACDGAGVVKGVTFAARLSETNTTTVKVVMNTLTKTGGGVLDLQTPTTVTGSVRVFGGTLRLPRAKAHGQPGLRFYFDGDSSATVVFDDNPENHTYRGIDLMGTRYAHVRWPKPHANLIYTGYLWVPGETTQTWNFASSICRSSVLVIDGQEVIRDRNVWDDRTKRLRISQPVALSAGRHTFKYTMHNTGDTVNFGAYPATNASAGVYWKASFGLAYDPQARCTTNSDDYLPLIDGKGDGQLFSTDTTPKAELDSATVHGSYGSLSMAGGTVLDVNDFLPYTPLEISSFSGAPTITNGILKITGTWALSASDVMAGGLVVAGDSGLVIADGVTVSISNVDVIPIPKSGDVPLVSCIEGSIVGCPRLVGAERHCLKVAADGKSIRLSRRAGLTFVIR